MRSNFLKSDDFLTKYKKVNLFNVRNISNKEKRLAKEQWNKFDMAILKLINKSLFRKPYHNREINLFKPETEQKPIYKKINFQNPLLNSVNNDLDDNSKSFQLKETLNSKGLKYQTATNLSLEKFFNQTKRLRNLRRIDNHHSYSLNDNTRNSRLNNNFMPKLSEHKTNNQMYKDPSFIEMQSNENEILNENNNDNDNENLTYRSFALWNQLFDKKTPVKESIILLSSRNRKGNIPMLKSHHSELLPLKKVKIVKGTKINLNYKIADRDFNIPSKLVKLSSTSS